jgi:peptidoglycan-associated lipoprotein
MKCRPGLTDRFDYEDSMRVTFAPVVLLAAVLAFTGCAKKKQPVLNPVAPPPAVATTPPPTSAPRATERIDEPLPVPPQPLPEDNISNRSLDDLNQDSPLQPAFFPLDAADLDDTGRAVVAANAEVMRKYPTWIVTIEGHCDERGTAEYNLALGERRSVAVKTYLVSLGISPDRLRTVSYGKEFPFDPGHNEDAWSKNRRAQFVITAK